MSHRSLLNPILLSDRVYSTMFVLYASKCSNNDELYRQRMLVCDKKSDEELADFLRIERFVYKSNRINECYCMFFSYLVTAIFCR